MSTAVVFPGQGSQYVGMGSDFMVDGLDGWFDKTCEKTGIDRLGSLVKNGPGETLQETSITQPAVFIVNQLIYRYLTENSAIEPDYFAGHSLGEYNALASAGWAGVDDLLSVVVQRGEAMGRAADRVEGGMAALLRIDVEAARDLCEAISTDPDVDGTVQVALYNSPDQLVISGSRPALDRAIEDAKEAGALKAVELDVSGPWHSQYMEPAVPPLRSALEDLQWNTKADPVVANVTADFQEGDPKDNLVKQLTEPVRWIDTVEKLLDEGVERFIEVGPGDSLTGMIERIVDRKKIDVNVFNTDSIDQTRNVIEAIT